MQLYYEIYAPKRLIAIPEKLILINYNFSRWEYVMFY